MLFSDNFIDLSKWKTQNCVYNDAKIENNNNKLIFECISNWCGVYTQPDCIINMIGDLIIEFDYTQNCHYSTACVPYFALINKNTEYIRDENYGMIRRSDLITTKNDDFVIIYLGNNYDSSYISSVSMYQGNKLLTDMNVHYNYNQKIHIKIEYISKLKQLNFYMNDNKILSSNITYSNKNTLFEINVNSYGSLISEISNFKIFNICNKYLIEQNCINYKIINNTLIGIDNKNNKDNWYTSILDTNNVLHIVDKNNFNLLKINES